jgi:hypothetical protein
MFPKSPQRRPRREKVRDHDDGARASRHYLLRALFASLACFVSVVPCGLVLTTFRNHVGSALPLISWVTSAAAVTASCMVHYYVAKAAAMAGRRHWLLAIVESVAALLRRGSGGRAEEPLVATGMRILSLGALLLPPDARADTLATACDVLCEATGAAPTPRAVSAVVLRLLCGMLTEAVRPSKRRLLGAGGGIGTTLTMTSSVLTLLGLHVSFAVGAGFVRRGMVQTLRILAEAKSLNGQWS